MGLEKNLLVNALLQKSKLESFIMGIGGETLRMVFEIDLKPETGEYAFGCEWKRPLIRPPQRWCYVERLEDRP